MAAAMPGSYQETVRLKGSSKCSNHKLKDVVYVCVDCNTLLCTTCGIKSFHNTHTLEELNEVAQEKKTAMLDFIDNSENNTLPRLKQDLVSTDQQVTTVCSEFKELSTNMQQQGETCKHEIDKVISDSTSICDEMERSNNDLLRQQRKGKQHRYDVIFAEVKECKKALQTGTDVDVYDTEFDTLGNDTDPNKPVLKTCHYTPCTAITDHLKQVIGKFTTGSTDDTHTLVATTPVVDPLDTYDMRFTGPTDTGKACVRAEKSPYPTPAYRLLDQSIITSQFSSATALSICPTRADEIWFLKSDIKTLLLVDNKGETKQTIELDSDTRDMCVSRVTGHLWFCSTDRTIYELQYGKILAAQFTINDIPTSLCITSGGRVIVGTAGRLTAYTTTGFVLHTSRNEEQTELKPVRMSHCSITGSLAVVHSRRNEGSEEEFPYDSTLCIIVYGRRLELKFTFRGKGIQGRQPVTPDTFGPFSIVYDSFGNLIIEDAKRKKIELLSGACLYLRTLHSSTGEGGAIGIGSGNALWLQMEDDKGTVMIKLLKYYKSKRAVLVKV